MSVSTGPKGPEILEEEEETSPGTDHQEAARGRGEFAFGQDTIAEACPQLCISEQTFHRWWNYIRSDNGPEFIAEAIKAFLRKRGVGTLYIEPGSPWQNAYSESFNSRFPGEVLNADLFTSVLEAKVLCEVRVVACRRRLHNPAADR